MPLSGSRSVATRALVCGALSLLLVACAAEVVTGTGDPNESRSGTSGNGGSSSSSSTSSSSGNTTDPPECTADPDCAHRDTDADPCTVAACQSGRCIERLVKGTPQCQCHDADDCTYYGAKSCNQIACEAHQCVKHVVPAGPAPKQKSGDCYADVCDGVSEDATRQFDAADLVDDGNPCTIESCDAATGLKKTNVANGTACGDGSVCFQGTCLACKPQNAASCGGEGPGEPQNDTSSTPGSYPQHTPFCAFTSGTDVDWYTFYAKDADLSYDVFDFKLWSTAPTLEVCIYVKCGSGSASGGCATKLAGPNGSEGCCWSGAPSALAPHWDLDCTGTSEDSGTAYLSVRAPGGDACEQYAIVGGY
jgi:hypothetical protein